jgi:hypothetical protein
MVGAINIDQASWLKNGLKEAFDAARAGGQSALLDKLMPPFTYWYAGTGADQLRANPFVSTNLATGNYNAIAQALATSNGLYQGVPGSTQGELVRRSGLGENFILTNRQFGTANFYGNLYNSQYHSLQAQVTLRPTHGFNFVATYTWSRNLGNNQSGTDPLNRRLDYGLLGSSRAHTLTTYGTFNLPLGSSGFAFRNSSGWVKELVEGWQLSWTSSMTSGLPYSPTTVASMYGGSAVDLINPALFDTKGGHVIWDPGARGGRYFGNKYAQVADPQCNNVAASLKTTCQTNLHALALASDPTQIVFQHATPGVRGSFSPNSVLGPGRWSLDMAISKNFKITEGKALNLRVDVNNIFNHPTPSGSAPFTYDQRTYAAGNPISDLNDVVNPFGYLGYKVGHRVFSAKVRLTF